MKDIIALEGEQVEGEPLLKKIIEKGERVYTLPSLDTIRERAKANIERLSDEIRGLERAVTPYLVELSEPLNNLKQELIEQYGGKRK